MALPRQRTSQDVEDDLVVARADLIRAQELRLTFYERYIRGVIDRLFDEGTALRAKCLR